MSPKPDLQWGIPEVDKQHATLLGCLDQLGRWCASSHRFTALVELLGSLNFHVREHFAVEEDLLRRHGCPGFESLIARNRQFVIKLDELTDEVLLGDLSTVEIIRFVRLWATDHIGREHAAYAEYLTCATQPAPC